jgi:transcriptional regulator with XRE-family HTH domain
MFSRKGSARPYPVSEQLHSFSELTLILLRRNDEEPMPLATTRLMNEFGMVGFLLEQVAMMKRDEPLIAETRKRTWIRQAREKRGWSQTVLAGLVGCSQNELSKIETGERLRIDPEIAVAIAKHLQMTREQVMFGDPEPRIVRILGEVLGNEAISMFPTEELLEVDWLQAEEMEGYRIGVDTLEPRFSRGEVLICHPASAALEECYGRECVVEFEGQRYAKHVEPGASVRLVTLRSYRAANPTLVDKTPKWIAPILAVITVEKRGCSA